MTSTYDGQVQHLPHVPLLQSRSLFGDFVLFHRIPFLFGPSALLEGYNILLVPASY